MIVISSAYVLAAQAAEIDADLPAVGYHNVVRADSATAVYQDPNYPASNLANPATHLEWRSSTVADQSVGFSNINIEEVDYVAIAKHNLGSAAITVYIVGVQDGIQTWLTEPVILADDSPAMFRFTPAAYAEIYIIMLAGTEPPRIAVAYVGKLLDMERKVYVGHTPLPYARKISMSSNRSVSGNFLGRIILGEGRESTVPFSLFTPDWCREFLDPFLVAAEEIPFFFAWRPGTYPLEVGFCDLMDDPMPAPVGPSNLIAFDLKVNGVA